MPRLLGPAAFGALLVLATTLVLLELADLGGHGSYVASAASWARLRLSRPSDPAASRFAERRPYGSLRAVRVGLCTEDTDAQLVAHSLPGLYDKSSALDGVKLQSDRVLSGSRSEALFEGTEQHVLVIGGSTSLGKHVVRDLLLFGHSHDAERGVDRDVTVTLLDAAPDLVQLDFALSHLPRFHRARRRLDAAGTVALADDYVDPRTASFASKDATSAAMMASGRLRVIEADHRNLSVVQSILLPEKYGQPTMQTSVDVPARRPGSSRTLPRISGIIHLAGATDATCDRNLPECLDQLATGADVLAAVVGEVDAETRPWVVVTRGAERAEALEQARMGVLPPSIVDLPPTGRRSRGRRRAEPSWIGRRGETLKLLAAGSPVHAISLALPPIGYIYGDPFDARRLPVPDLVHRALGHLPMHAAADFPSMETDDRWSGASLLWIEDAAEAVLSAAELLARAATAGHLGARSIMADIAVAQSGPIDVSAVVALIQSLTQSDSPIAVTASNRSEPAWIEESRSDATSVLDLRSPASIELGLRAYVSALLARQTDYVLAQKGARCRAPQTSARIEQAMLDTDGCFVQLVAVFEGLTHSFGCSQDLESYAQPVAMLNAVPHVEGVRGVDLKVGKTDGEEGVWVELSCPTGPGGQGERVVWVDGAYGHFATEADEPAGVSRFNVEVVRREAAAFGLSIPSSDGKTRRPFVVRAAGKGVDRFRASFAPTAETPEDHQVAQFRLNEICCSAQQPRTHEFMRSDPLWTYQIAFPSTNGLTSMADSTLSNMRCREMRSAAEHLKTLSSGVEMAPSTCDRELGEGSLWRLQGQPVCSIDCAAPVRCIVTGSCRCPLDRCVDNDLPPIGSSVRFGQPDEPLASLADRVEALAWDHLIRAAARSAFHRKVDDLPRAHVLSISPEVDNHLSSEACYNLAAAPVPFSSDHLLIEALRMRNAPADVADFVVVPFYQGCYYNYITAANTFRKLADTVSEAETQITLSDRLLASNIVLPFTHDWGSCTGWWSRHEEVLGRTPPPPMGKAIAWQTNGDYSTRCVKLHRDIIIPSRTRNMPALYAAYGDLSKVPAAHERPYLAFFAGGMRGLGAIPRTRLGCGRTPGSRDDKVLYQAYGHNKDYVDTLALARFCILPRGITAWSTRTFEAIYAGCIPAIMADRNAFPFEDILDWSAFSVTIPETTPADRVDALLEAIDDASAAAMQAAVLRVRDLFVYAPRTGEPAEELERRGPLRMALVSMAMRIHLAWPVDRCPA